MTISPQDLQNLYTHFMALMGYFATALGTVDVMLSMIERINQHRHHRQR